jgi:26S proteasome regulatory subunit N1
MLHACGEHLPGDNDFQAVAVLGISLIAMGEEVGTAMSTRAFNHLLQYGEPVVRRTVPMAMGLLSISNPNLQVMDTLSKLSHDSDVNVAQGAIMGLGLIGAGTNNSRIAGLLRQLSAYYCKESEPLFTVRIAQGLLHLGKGLVSLNPFHCHGGLLSKVGLAGILGSLHACFDFSGCKSSLLVGVACS